MSSDYQIDIDAQAVQDSALEFNKIYEENEKLKAQQREQELLLQQQQEQATAEFEDPRDKEGGGGIRGVSKEIRSAIGGGLQDTASSLVTLPERPLICSVVRWQKNSKQKKAMEQNGMTGCR